MQYAVERRYPVPVDPVPGSCHAHHRHPLRRRPDRVADPQRVHRLLEDDRQRRRGGHRRHPRRRAGRRLRLQLQRPLRAAGAAHRALPAAAARGRSELAAERRRRQSRSAPHLGDDVRQREAGRTRRAIGGDRHGGHGGVGCRRQDRRQAAVPAAGRALQRRAGRRQGVRLRGWRLLLPRQGPDGAAGRDAQVPRPRLLGREDEDRRGATRRRPRAHRGGAEGRGIRQPARGRRQRALRSGDRHRVREGARAVRPVLVRGGRRPARLRAAGRARGALRAADGDRREPVLDAGRAQPDPARRHAQRPRLAAVRLRAVVRPGRVPADAATC